VAADDAFLSRWSRRKSRSKERPGEPRAPAPGSVTPAQTATAQALPEPAAPAEPAPLPPVDALTPESDFSPFMNAGVDPDTRHRALKALFADPRYSTMDMLDVYMDDYSKPDPLPDGWLGKLQQVSRLGDRAGRDREEARARAERGEAPPADGTPADAPAAEAPVAGGDPAGERDPAEASAPAGIPPRSAGESDA
jgi:hypothetical protein